MIMENEPEFTESETRTVKDFLKTDAGQKVLQTLDMRAASRNNLLKVINLVGNQADLEKVGRVCALHAAETRTFEEVIEFLKEIGGINAD